MPLPKTKVFRRFPDEIWCIRPEDDLKLATKTDECAFNKKQKSFYAVSTFGLCAGSWGKANCHEMSLSCPRILVTLWRHSIISTLAPLESDLGGETPNSLHGSFSKEFDSLTSSSNPEDGGDVSSFLSSPPMSSPSDTSSSSIEDTL